MKHLMKYWREYLMETGFGEGDQPEGELYKKQTKYLEEQATGKPKVVFMAGAPGVGKSHVREKLGLDEREEFKHLVVDNKTGAEQMKLNIIDPDKIYVPLLKSKNLGANVAKIKSDYLDAQQTLRNIFKELLNLEPPSIKKKGYAHKGLMDIWDEITDTEGNLRVDLEVTDEETLRIAKTNYDLERDKCTVQGQCFAQAQIRAKEQQHEWFEQGKSIIIDGTAGFYSVIINQKETFEKNGYDVAMVFVDAPLEVAVAANKERERKLDPFTIKTSMANLVGGTYVDPISREEVTKPSMIKPFIDRHGRERLGYEKEFGDNYFYVANDRIHTEENIAKIKPRFDRFLNSNIQEDFQQDVKRQHKKMKIRLIGKGSNKTKAKPFVKNPSMKRTKSAPPDFGGS